MIARVSNRIKVVKVRITDKALKVIKDEAQALDMKSLGVFSRIIDWYSLQSETVRRGVLRLLPADMEQEILRLVLEGLKKRRGL